MRYVQTLLFTLCTTLHAAGAESESELMDAFAKCRSSLTNLRNINDSDRAAMSELRTRFDTSGELSSKTAAADLQLSLWIEDASTRMVNPESNKTGKPCSLLHQKGALASGYISWQASVGILEGSALLEARRSLLDKLLILQRRPSRWPPVFDAKLTARPLLKSYATWGNPLPQSQSSSCAAYFDENMFDEASGVLAAMDLEGIADVAVRAQANNIVRQCEEIKPLWEAELAVRSKEQDADNLPRVQIQTPKGSILIELFEDDAPNTVANFISLVQSDYYDGIAFHRFEPNFMIQGGCPNTKSGEGTYGTGGPGYTIADECNVDNARLHFADSVAMAKTSAPNTGGSQFYLNHRPTTWLNNRHTVFGRVLEGRDVACKLRKDDRIDDIVVVRLRNGSTYVPVTIAETTDAAGEDSGKADDSAEAQKGS